MLKSFTLKISLQVRLALPAIVLTILAIIPSPRVSAADAMLYGSDGNDFYQFTGSSSVSNLQSSGWTTLILFALSVQPNGDITYGGQTLVTGGQYVGDPNWAANIFALKTAPTTVYRYEVCVGGWGDGSFANIENLVNSQGTGPGSVLYENFLALRNAVTGIDAINDDDEETYDLNSSTAFGEMLGGMGFKFTFAPYTNQGFWVNLKNNLGSICDVIYLQCYSGGEGNDPASWESAFGGFHVTPGEESNYHSQSQFTSWQSSAGITGGFFWPDVTWAPGANWGWQEIVNGIGIPNSVYTLANDNSGLSLAPQDGGTGDGTPLVQYHLGSSDDFIWHVTYQGTIGGSDTYEIWGDHSGRAVTITGDSMSDNAPMELYDYSGDHSQLLVMDGKSGGYYRMVFVHSGLAMVVEGASTASGAAIVQYNNDNALNAWWQLRQNQVPGSHGS